MTKRDRNHLNPEFTRKIRGILYEGHEDKVTPVEFVLYLLETHKENGLYTPITRDQLSMKVKGREHYFTEVYSDYVPGTTLPKPLTTALANLTGTEPFFWMGTEYSLAQAKNIQIDMTKDLRLIPENQVSVVVSIGSQSGKDHTR